MEKHVSAAMIREFYMPIILDRLIHTVCDDPEVLAADYKDVDQSAVAIALLERKIRTVLNGLAI